MYSKVYFTAVYFDPALKENSILSGFLSRF